MNASNKRRCDILANRIPGSDISSEVVMLYPFPLQSLETMILGLEFLFKDRQRKILDQIKPQRMLDG
jgi:hypothetical protein